MFCFDLGDIQAGHFQVGLLEHIIHNFAIRRLGFGRCNIHVIHVKSYLDNIIWFFLGNIASTVSTLIANE